MLKVVGASWNKIRASTLIIGIVFVFGIFVVILGEFGQSDEDGNWSATVYWNKESGFEIVFWGQGKKIDEVPKGAARAFYQPRVNTTGWAILDIETQPNYSDWVQAFGAGMLEGSLSWQMIDWHRQNTITARCAKDESFCEIARIYVRENMKWLKEMYMNQTSSYWHQIHLFMLQLEGIQKGFEEGVKRSRAHDVEEMTIEDFVFLNSIGDMVDLKYKFSSSKTYKNTAKPIIDSTLWTKLKRSISYSYSEQNLQANSKTSGKDMEKYKCGKEKLSLASTFVKLVPKSGKLFIAHNSAAHYSSMLKMLKHYQFPYRMSKKNRDSVPGKKITFSSYPGVLHSLDDFFVIQNEVKGQKLVVSGTPLPVFNEKLWNLTSAVGQVFIGPRLMAANRLASNGKTLASILSQFNSGTGNKEWVIADVGKFESIARYGEEDGEIYKKELSEAKEILYVAEQIPGSFHFEDKTDTLKAKTYWASYGVPFFQSISDLSGMRDMVEQYGEVYSYEETPVAKIFRRDHVNATDMKSIAKLMRSNFYKTDPFSYNNPRCAVGSRGDLANDVQEAAPVGVTDTKIFSSVNSNLKYFNSTGQASSKTLSDKIPREIFQIKAGPPFSDSWNILSRTKNKTESENENAVHCDTSLGPFIWPKSEFHESPHFGHPEVWNFEPIIIF